MKVKLLNPNKVLNENFIVSEAARRLNEPGTVLLLPTGGVYGLVCKWSDKKAKEKVYKIKRSRAFQMILWDTQEIPNCGVMFSKPARKLAMKFCPGPITIVDKDGANVALKIPGGESLLQNILEAADAPLAIISAGRDADTVEKAVAKFYSTPDAAADMGQLPPEKAPSTVVELISESLFKILRPGAISEAAIRDALSA